jgi:hypothetical protein
VTIGISRISFVIHEGGVIEESEELNRAWKSALGRRDGLSAIKWLQPRMVGDGGLGVPMPGLFNSF